MGKSQYGAVVPALTIVLIEILYWMTLLIALIVLDIVVINKYLLPTTVRNRLPFRRQKIFKVN